MPDWPVLVCPPLPFVLVWPVPVVPLDALPVVDPDEVWDVLVPPVVPVGLPLDALVSLALVPVPLALVLVAPVDVWPPPVDVWPLGPVPTEMELVVVLPELLLV